MGDLRLPVPTTVIRSCHRSPMSGVGRPSDGRPRGPCGPARRSLLDRARTGHVWLSAVFAALRRTTGGPPWVLVGCHAACELPGRGQRPVAPPIQGSPGQRGKEMVTLNRGIARSPDAVAPCPSRGFRRPRLGSCPGRGIRRLHPGSGIAGNPDAVAPCPSRGFRRPRLGSCPGRGFRRPRLGSCPGRGIRRLRPGSCCLSREFRRLRPGLCLSRGIRRPRHHRGRPVPELPRVLTLGRLPARRPGLSRRKALQPDMTRRSSGRAAGAGCCS
ncbi:hypothetical protein RKD49_005654 [Streptomyces glaucescens]